MEAGELDLWCRGSPETPEKQGISRKGYLLPVLKINIPHLQINKRAIPISTINRVVPTADCLESLRWPKKAIPSTVMDYAEI